MRTVKFAAAAVSAILLAGAAQAADAPYYGGGSSYGSSYAPASTWDGFYMGGVLGYGFGDASGFEPDGFLGGITAGINYQVNTLLFGGEADIMVAGISDEGVEDYDMNWVGTVRGRIGYAFDRFVVFGTGGFAWTNAEYDGAGSDTNFHAGWTVGAGLEAAITSRVSAKVEYLYMSFGDELYSPGGYIEPDLHTFRLGVNYRF